MSTDPVRRHELADLLTAYLRRLYDSECRLMELMPRLADATESTGLRRAYRRHFERALRRILRLEAAFSELGESPQRAADTSVQAAVAEAETGIADRHEPDIASVACVQAIRGCSDAGYQAALWCARKLRKTGIVALLSRIDEEERERKNLLWEALSERKVG